MNPWGQPQVLAIGRVGCDRCPRVIELFAWDTQQVEHLDRDLANIRHGHNAQHATEDAQAARVEEER